MRSTFCSSLMPNFSSFGFPVRIARRPSSITAGSTQPPLTEPLTSHLLGDRQRRADATRSRTFARDDRRQRDALALRQASAPHRSSRHA